MDNGDGAAPGLTSTTSPGAPRPNEPDVSLQTDHVVDAQVEAVPVRIHVDTNNPEQRLPDPVGDG
jgi:hypothetical protein